MNERETEGWKEAAIAWSVCASIHETWAKGKDALYKTRHADFVRHADDARALATPPSAPTAVEPDERDLFAARWQQLEHMYSKGATANTLGYYIGRPERLDYAAQLRSEHDAARASKGTP